MVSVNFFYEAVFCESKFYLILSSLGYQSFMLSLKSQISILDNFVIREESISPVLAMMHKEAHSHKLADTSVIEVNST